MTSRKPKLDLLYVDALQPRLQLQLVTPSEPSPMQRHAKQWGVARKMVESLPMRAPITRH